MSEKKELTMYNLPDEDLLVLISVVVIPTAMFLTLFWSMRKSKIKVGSES